MRQDSHVYQLVAWLPLETRIQLQHRVHKSLIRNFDAWLDSLPTDHPFLRLIQGERNPQYLHALRQQGWSSLVDQILSPTPPALDLPEVEFHDWLPLLERCDLDAGLQKRLSLLTPTTLLRLPRSAQLRLLGDLSTNQRAQLLGACSQ